MQEQHYTAAPYLADSRAFLRELGVDLRRALTLSLTLFIRDFTARYRRTVLGYLWAVLPPIAMTLTFVFLRQRGVLDQGQQAHAYVVTVLAGVTFWQFFADAVSQPVRSVQQYKTVIAKARFPYEAILLSGIYQVMFDGLVRFLLLGAAMAVYQLGGLQSVIPALLG